MLWKFIEDMYEQIQLSLPHIPIVSTVLCNINAQVIMTTQILVIGICPVLI